MVSLKTVQVHWNFASVSVLKRLTTWVVAIDNSCQSTQNFNSVSVLKIYSNCHRLDWYTELANFPESLCLFGHVRQPAPPSVALAKLLANWHFHMLPTSFSGIFLLLLNISFHFYIFISFPFFHVFFFLFLSSFHRDYSLCPPSSVGMGRHFQIMQMKTARMKRQRPEQRSPLPFNYKWHACHCHFQIYILPYKKHQKAEWNISELVSIASTFLLQLKM